MNRWNLLPLLTAGLLAAPFSAQTRIVDASKSGDSAERPFAVVQSSSMRFAQGSLSVSAPLFRYVHDHPEGDYVAFAENGRVYRLDGADRLREVSQLFAPMAEFAARQKALAQAQERLARQQARIAKTQSSLAGGQQQMARQQAESTPKDQAQLGQGQGTMGQSQGDLGAVQGALGEEQGDLGRAQGELGHRQGELARAAGKRLQQMFDQCLADGSCPRVAS